MHALLLSLVTLFPAGDEVAGSAQVDSTKPAPAVELLDVAYRAASAFPVNPHIKNRARAQEVVFHTALKIGEPARALQYGEGIANWRRGAAYADLASWHIEHGADAEEAQRLLDLAAVQLDAHSAELEKAQEWRLDRIRAKMARAQMLLGNQEEAAIFLEGVSKSELRLVQDVRARRVTEKSFDDAMMAVDQVLEKGDFDEVQGALITLVELYDGFFMDEERLPKIEERFDRIWIKLPILIALDTRIELADHATKYGDRDRAIAHLRAARLSADTAQWAPEDHVAYLGHLAAARHRAGETERAKADLRKAHETFEAKRKEIINIYRAGALRALAEAWLVLCDEEKAGELYAKALEAGMENPNSRPRTDDLVATCCSMVENGFTPQPKMSARIEEIQKGMKAPW